jgi:hypothetical protein
MLERDPDLPGARRTRRERQDLAGKAAQAASDRVRAEQPWTAASRESTINLQMQPNGDRDVSLGTTRPTPEEMARLEGSAAER